MMFSVITSLLFAQTEAELFKRKQLARKELTPAELKGQFLNNDFSKLWTRTDNQYVYGFIGDEYERIRIKFISITKSKSSPDTYEVYGKSMVKNNVDEFHGTIKILTIKKLKTTDHGCAEDDKYKDLKSQFAVLGDYNFAENEKQPHAGIFKGTFKSEFFIDAKDRFMYDDIVNCSDNYTNNQFVGQWAQYNSNVIKRCNWGDFRIPNSGDLDMGAGDFSPADKYLKYGWQNLRDFSGTDKKLQAKAKTIEEAKWWQ